MSLGGSSESQAEKDAIAYATSKGVLVIASAGNDGTGTVAGPACDLQLLQGWRIQLAPGASMAAPQMTGTAAIVASVTGLAARRSARVFSRRRTPRAMQRDMAPAA